MNFSSPKTDMLRSRETNPPVVLYVSDDTAYLNEVRHSLGQAGFSVVTAKSPTEAVELTSQSEFDALISDYNLLQTDALSLYEEIRKILGEMTPPTIVVADHDEAVMRARCRTAGADGVHVKGESHEKLVDHVISILRDIDKRNRIAAAASRRQFKGGTDTLTRVANQEHFSRRLNGESMASYRDQSFLSLLMITVDRYERMVDQYGKQRAEFALVQIARLIESELRSRDCVARYAEYTFAVALPDTPQPAAAAVGRRLRLKLSAAEFGNLDQSVTLSVSVGVTTRPPGMRKTPKEMCEATLLAAEAAMKMGGNRVVADTALTGCPLVLAVGDPNGEMGAMARVLETYDRVELRIASSYEEATRVLSEVPVALVLAEDGSIGAHSGLDLLTWIKGRFPAILRVLASDRADPVLMVKAVNEASVHYFVPLPSNFSKLPGIVESLLFT
jgi:two-component system, chemotaxis family, response regulator WspR